jgi:hypothetical protein
MEGEIMGGSEMEREKVKHKEEREKGRSMRKRRTWRGRWQIIMRGKRQRRRSR